VPVVSNKEAELSLTHSVIAVAGVKGEDPFDQAYPNVQGVAAFYGSPLQFAVSPKLGLTSIGDIKDNKAPIKLAVGDPGSTGELATKRILEAYGMTYADIESWGGQILFKDMGEAAAMYGDDIINGFTLLTLAPNGPLQQVASNKEIQLLPVEQDKIQQMIDHFGYASALIPKEAYAFLSADIPSFQSQVVLITSDDRPEQEIYQITKGLLENIDYLRSIHTNLKDLQPSDMVGTAVELHPGAARAYKEAGVL
jgi:TRAP transporter TAXI family solute receptor